MVGCSAARGRASHVKGDSNEPRRRLKTRNVGRFGTLRRRSDVLSSVELCVLFRCTTTSLTLTHLLNVVCECRTHTLQVHGLTTRRNGKRILGDTGDGFFNDVRELASTRQLCSVHFIQLFENEFVCRIFQRTSGGSTLHVLLAEGLMCGVTSLAIFRFETKT